MRAIYVLILLANGGLVCFGAWYVLSETNEALVALAGVAAALGALTLIGLAFVVLEILARLDEILAELRRDR